MLPSHRAIEACIEPTSRLCIELTSSPASRHNSSSDKPSSSLVESVLGRVASRGGDGGSGGASMTVSVQGPKRRGLMIGDEQVGHAGARVDLDRSHQIPSGSSIRSEKGANGEKLLRCEVREIAVKSSPWAAALRAAAKSKSQNLVQSGCHCFPCVPSASWRQY